jgi:hypothetical protein
MAGIEGEGSTTASKDYNERTKKFVDSGKVDQAARDAAPRNDKEAHDMKEAEQEGRSHSKAKGTPPSKSQDWPFPGRAEAEGKDEGKA